MFIFLLYFESYGMGNLCTRSSETNVFDEFPNESAKDFHDAYCFDGFPADIVDNLVTRGCSFLKVKTECLDSDSKSAVSEECLDSDSKSTTDSVPGLASRWSGSSGQRTLSCLDSTSKSEVSRHFYSLYSQHQVSDVDDVLDDVLDEVPDDVFDEVLDEVFDEVADEVPKEVPDEVPDIDNVCGSLSFEDFHSLTSQYEVSDVSEDDSLTFSSASDKSSTPPSRVGSCWSDKSFESLRKYDMENWIWKPEQDNIRRCKLTITAPTLWDETTPPPGIPRLSTLWDE